jgi:AcrR family transcriptional regulator
VPQSRSPSELAEPDVEAQSALRARAAAMPPEQRRASILEATVPLLIAYGTEITTRQIAAAACVAEGTLFRVFADKDTLIAAAIEKAFDPEPVAAELRAIDPSLDLEARCEAAVAIIQARVASTWRILTAFGGIEAAERARPPREREQGIAAVVHALAAMLEPDRARLRMKPIEAADLLRGVSIASSHPALTMGEPRSPHEIVSVLLHGIRKPTQGGRKC